MKTFLVASASVVAMLSAVPATAQSNQTQSQADATAGSDWSFAITPFLWNASIPGEGSDDNSSLLGLEMAGMLDVRARKGDWEFGGNWVVVGLGGSKTGTGPFGVTRTVALDAQVAEIDAKYYVRDQAFGYFGARYYNAEYSLAFGAPISTSGSVSASWVDPIIGAGFTAPISEQFSVLGKADIGGFGIGSDFSWQVQAYAKYQPWEHVSLIAGYRHLDFNYNTDLNIPIDLAISGPIVAVRFNF